MKTTGIICEYNPMHSGHAYQLAVARERGADCIIALMSGSFTERGEIAVADKYTRAEVAIRAGADLVLELPYPYCAGGAEYFAKAGVSILERLSIDSLLFGSESGDLDFLSRTADIALSNSFKKAYTEAGKDRVGSAAAYFNLLCTFVGVPEFGSNDVLGIEYLKAIRTLGASIAPEVLCRVGSGYHDDTLTDNIHPSATALRLEIERALTAGESVARNYAKASGLTDTAPFSRAVERGLAPVRLENAPPAILAFYRMHEAKNFMGIAEMHGGLAERIVSAAENAVTLSDFYRLAATKKYTDSRVRRAVLYGLTGVTEDDLRRSPAFVNLLGANKTGRAFLAAYRKKKDRDLPVITRPAAILNAGADADFQRQAMLQRRAESLFTLFLPEKKAAGYYLRSRAVILE